MEGKDQKEHDIIKAEDAGASAYLAGKSLAVCPFESQELIDAFIKGYRIEQENWEV